LALSAEDERVRRVCAVAVLDRAGVRPADFNPDEEKDHERQKFDPRDFSAEELDKIEAALRLIVERSEEKFERSARFVEPSGAGKNEKRPLRYLASSPRRDRARHRLLKLLLR
jgi:hypothetical protein